MGRLRAIMFLASLPIGRFFGSSFFIPLSGGMKNELP